MSEHTFIFQKGLWIGEGTVSFSVSADQIKFVTKWEVEAPKDNVIRCVQTVQMHGIDELVTNTFDISLINPESFQIMLTNDSLETVIGKGIIEPDKIAWEFRQLDSFEGFEIYERNKDDEYTMHAEYASPDQFRTIIHGRVWKKLL